MEADPKEQDFGEGHDPAASTGNDCHKTSKCGEGKRHLSPTLKAA